MKRKNMVGWFVYVAIFAMFVILGGFFAKTNGQLASLAVGTLTIILMMVPTVAKERKKRYTRRESRRNKELLSAVPPMAASSQKMRDITKSYREYEDHTTPLEQRLQFLALVMALAVIAIAIFQRGPLVLCLIRKFFMPNG